MSVSAFLDLAQMRAERQLPTTMQDWIRFMSSYLDLNGYPVLEGFGNISKELADKKALIEYSKFRAIQDRNYESDFEKMMKSIDKKESEEVN